MNLKELASTKKVLSHAAFLVYMRTGRTALQIATSYQLGSTVAAKRFVARMARVTNTRVVIHKGAKKANEVGRRPNVYTLALG